VLVWLAYTLLGWYLSAHHIVWLVGAFVAAVALAVASKSSPWLERLVRFFSQGLFVVLTVSILLALAVTWSLLFPLIVLPFVTTFLAEVEMRFTGFSKLDTFWFLTVLAAFGLGMGEIIDIVLLPSIRY
jgi:hypothetical protein